MNENGEAAALGDFEQILAQHPRLIELLRPTDPRDRKTCGEIVALYLAHGREEICERSWLNRLRDLGRFVQAFGPRPIGECVPLELKAWLFAQAAWKSPWKRVGVKISIQRCFDWATEQR